MSICKDMLSVLVSVPRNRRDSKSHSAVCFMDEDSTTIT